MIRKLILASSFVLVLVASGCSRESRWNVLVVTFDTTRADHMGCYGNEGIETPAVDGLAAEGFLFENAYSPIPITLPAHSSILTGKVPFAHGVRDNGIFQLGDEQLTLAEILKQEGYRTGAAVGSFPLLGSTGISQGFEFFDDHVTSTYEDIYGQRVFPKERLFFDERRAARVNEAVLPWLEENHSEPFFLWVHYFDPHLPHEAPAPFDQLYAHEPYDGEIAYSDQSLGTLLDHLRRLDVYDNTLVVFASDHGEGRGEHGESTHSMLVYNTTLHVPLVVKTPSGMAGIQPPGFRVQDRVGLVDILPTILDLLGIPIPQDIQGRSLRHLLEADVSEGASSPKELYAETLSPRITRSWGEQRALISGDYKYIHGPRKELFHLDHDPLEVHNLVDKELGLAGDLQARLAEYLQEHRVEGLDSSVELDQETAIRLQALGYLQSAGASVGVIDEKLRDDGAPPQDHVGSIGEYSHAKNLLFQGRIPEGKGVLLGLLKGDPKNPHYLDLLASAEMRLGRHEAALEILEELEVLAQGYPPPDKVLETAAQVLLAQGKPDQALLKLRRSQGLVETASGQYQLALIYGALGRTGMEKKHLGKALELDPALVPARIDLGIRHAAAGDLEAAEACFLKALSDGPYLERSFFNYGVFLIQTERPRDALPYFRRAVELRADYVEALYALVETLVRLDEAEQAREAYEALEEADKAGQYVQLASELLEVKP